MSDDCRDCRLDCTHTCKHPRRVEYFLVTREDIINAGLSPMMRAANVGEGARFRAMLEALADNLIQSSRPVPEWATHVAVQHDRGVGHNPRYYWQTEEIKK